MNTEDYIVTLALLALVIRQIRGKAISVFGLSWPITIVLYAGYKYLHGVPSSGRNLDFLIGCITLGAALGVCCGIFTKVFRESDKIMAKATGLAVVFWIIGISARLAFGLYAENGGGTAIYNFSIRHGLDIRIWAPALVTMSLAEVIGRTIPLAYRAHRLTSVQPSS